jgi:hypothetical protein
VPRPRQTHSGGRTSRGGDVRTTRIDIASVQYDRHHAASENCPRLAFAQSIFQTSLETIDEDARRAKAGESDICRIGDPKHRIQRKLFEIEANRGDVLAEISGLYFEVGRPQYIEQFDRDQVDLPKVRRLRIATRQVPVPDKPSIMRVALDPESRRQNDRELVRLAESMLAVDRDGDYLLPTPSS